MSTETNIQIAQKAYADFGKGDIAGILEILDDGIVWITPGNLPDSGTHRGKAGVARFFQLVDETWDFQAFEPKDYLATGDQLAVCGSYTATSRVTGRQVSSDWVMVWKFRDGKVTNFQEYTDTLALQDAITVRAAA